MTDSESFKFKARITGANPPAGNTKDVDIAAPLKYLGNFQRTLEIPLIYWETDPILTWSANCVIINQQVQKHLK